MSFSSDVKEELAQYEVAARHCNLAEIAAIVSMCGKVINAGNKSQVFVQTENVAVAKKYFALLKKTFNIEADISVRRNACLKKNRVYSITVRRGLEAQRLLMAIKWESAEEKQLLVEPLVIQSSCCKQAFIRGAFLASGSISDPQKFYHLEFVCQTNEKAEQLRDIINSFDMETKIVPRKHSFVVYLKEGDQIVVLMTHMGAYSSIMKMENIRIEKNIKNSVNRRINCEVANSQKTVEASVEQIENIQLIQSTVGLETLAWDLQLIAELRLQNPDYSLQQIGENMTPPLGKSGVNHRLKKIKKIADMIKEKSLESE
ncbi:MAG: DNA-binding protein WhiA [Lachnospiraceae bacterium]